MMAKRPSGCARSDAQRGRGLRTRQDLATIVDAKGAGPRLSVRGAGHLRGARMVDRVEATAVGQEAVAGAAHSRRRRVGRSGAAPSAASATAATMGTSGRTSVMGSLVVRAGQRMAAIRAPVPTAAAKRRPMLVLPCLKRSWPSVRGYARPDHRVSAPEHFGRTQLGDRRTCDGRATLPSTRRAGRDPS